MNDGGKHFFVGFVAYFTLADVAEAVATHIYVVGCGDGHFSTFLD